MPSRWMRNVTSARSAPLRVGGSNRSAICRTMLLQVPGIRELDPLGSHRWRRRCPARPSGRRPPAAPARSAASSFGGIGTRRRRRRRACACAVRRPSSAVGTGAARSRRRRAPAVRRRAAASVGGSACTTPICARARRRRDDVHAVHRRRARRGRRLRDDERRPRRARAAAPRSAIGTPSGAPPRRALTSSHRLPGSATSPTSPTPAARITASTRTTVPYGTPCVGAEIHAARSPRCCASALNARAELVVA